MAATRAIAPPPPGPTTYSTESVERIVPMTYEEYLALPGVEGRSEWVDGKAIFFMPSSVLHADLTLFLGTLLRIFARRLGLGKVLAAPMEMRILDPFVSRDPDVLFVATRNLERLERIRLDGPADLAIEIVSDDSVGRDRGNKFDEYERAGVGEYWIADPRPSRHRFDAWVLGEDAKFRVAVPAADGRYHSTSLPGFWLRPEWLWENPLPDETALLEEILSSIPSQA